MTLPGYEINEDFSQAEVSLGDYEGIHDAYTPDAECPMPESERLSNYIMRLLATMSLAGFKLIQSTDSADKSPSLAMLREQKQWLQKLENISLHIYYCASNLTAISEALGNLTLTVSDETNVSLGSIVESLTLLQVDFNLLKLQIDRLYIDTINVDAGDMGGSLSGIAEAIDKGLCDDFYGEGKSPILRDIEQEIVNDNMSDDILDIGLNAVYLKSKVVRD